MNKTMGNRFNLHLQSHGSQEKNQLVLSNLSHFPYKNKQHIFQSSHMALPSSPPYNSRSYGSPEDHWEAVNELVMDSPNYRILKELKPAMLHWREDNSGFYELQERRKKWNFRQMCI